MYYPDKFGLFPLKGCPFSASNPRKRNQFNGKFYAQDIKFIAKHVTDVHQVRIFSSILSNFPRYIWEIRLAYRSGVCLGTFSYIWGVKEKTFGILLGTNSENS